MSKIERVVGEGEYCSWGLDEGTFGFTVDRILEDDTELWSVYLPHQCGSWTINSSEDIEEGDYVPVSREKVIENMTDFIAEAQAALDAIKAYPKEMTGE